MRCSKSKANRANELGENDIATEWNTPTGLVFCWEDGRPIYPDTITERFNRLVEAARFPLIRLHDVRHT